ncbi:hypothetical protein QN277_008760 [Acacia crassicarpa]|uniref:Uncharacterized protein n=1 Tax=Acacia crassicarpa TaxID=499986 RepID=A0AAE1JQI0_9FABA|nr:hypothetical protein QN277_008760 [Acacia crassicarpa]
MSNPAIASLPISGLFNSSRPTPPRRSPPHSFPSDFEVEFFATQILKRKVIPLCKHCWCTCSLCLSKLGVV